MYYNLDNLCGWNETKLNLKQMLYTVTTKYYWIDQNFSHLL